MMEIGHVRGVYAGVKLLFERRDDHENETPHEQEAREP